MAIVECAGIDGRMKTIIPRPVVNPPHCPAGFFFFVFIWVHLFSFIVSLYGFVSVVLILLFFFLFYYSVLIISFECDFSV